MPLVRLVEIGLISINLAISFKELVERIELASIVENSLEGSKTTFHKEFLFIASK